MDNLTHTLVGLVAGDSLARSTRAASGGLSPDTRRAFFVTMAAIGGSLPDIDLLVTEGILGGDKLGYLLHHRGHTHTVLGCVALAFLLYACAEGWARMRSLTLVRSDRIALGGMALLSVLLHLVMDSLNSYGVHAYWPFYNGWQYGDSVFIIEPLYWAAAAPMLFVVRSWSARIFVALTTLAAVGLGIFVNLTLPVWCVGIVLLIGTLVVVGKRGTPRTAALTSAALMLCVTAVFICAGWIASSRVGALAATVFPQDARIDQALTPIPTNPLCWDVLLMQTGGGRYTVRHGRISIAPALIPAERCPRIRLSPGRTAPMAAVSAPSSREVQWLGEFSMPEGALASLTEGRCEAYELLQFARVPFVGELDGRQVLGDMRFDGEPSLGFAEIELGERGAPCRYDVPWVPPRAALLERVTLPAAAR
jgi:inner membrane protein